MTWNTVSSLFSEPNDERCLTRGDGSEWTLAPETPSSSVGCKACCAEEATNHSSLIWLYQTVQHLQLSSPVTNQEGCYISVWTDR